VAATANSPCRAARRGDAAVIVLTECDSNRLAQFPNPSDLDLPDLYRSHADYVRISTDLVRRRVRFGNNNWTPTRARSDVASVANLIHVTTDQLHDVYVKGIYGIGEQDAVETLAQRIELENMVARVELPMSRVEIRCDEGGHALDLAAANLVFKQLLLMWSYANPTFGAMLRYDADDVARARRNEASAIQHGLRGEVEHPFTHARMTMREFLGGTIAELRPLAEALEWDVYLEPLDALAAGAPNAAERLRERLQPLTDADDVVPLEALHDVATERRELIARDLRVIAERISDLGDEAVKLHELLHNATEAAKDDPSALIQIEPLAPAPAEIPDQETTAEIVDLSRTLVRIPSVTNCPIERLDEVYRAARLIAGFLRDAGLKVQLYDRDKYPSVLASFPGQLTAPVMLSGHFDVVAPDPDDGQFDPYIEGDYLWGRGSADMKTVVATYMIWMRDVVRQQPARFPPINLLLVGNEENGELEPVGTPHVLADLKAKHGYEPSLLIAGERTGEKGEELFGDICIENRGVVRVEFIARGMREHTGVGAKVADLGARIIDFRTTVRDILERRLTLDAPDGWKTEYRFPFLSVGEAGVYNITSDLARLGLEIRPIPEDDVADVLDELRSAAEQQDLEIHLQTREAGVACNPGNPYLQTLIAAVRDTSGQEPVLGRKKAGTSGRFAPGGQAVIWGQTGIGPHSPAERHFIPSIRGYYDVLHRFAAMLLADGGRPCAPVRRAAPSGRDQQRS
jgi:succinyl-diaminopimelate desuccinylase